MEIDIENVFKFGIVCNYMKRWWFVLLFLIPLASAQLFEGRLTEGETDLVRLAVFLIMFLIILAVLSGAGLFKQYKGLNVIIALALSLLGARFMSDSELLYGVSLPAGILGIVLITFIPFLIVLAFLHMSGISRMGRRLTWIVFGVFYILMMISNYSNYEGLERIYSFVVLGLIVLVFLFDSFVQKIFRTFFKN